LIPNSGNKRRCGCPIPPLPWIGRCICIFIHILFEEWTRVEIKTMLIAN
jgi:hypothetical protein